MYSRASVALSPGRPTETDPMSLSFTAIDFETASAARASACSVGIAVVNDGAVDFSSHFYIRPPTGLEFTNSWLHGITAEHCEDAPSWTPVMERVSELAVGMPFVAYSAFDKSVWNAAWEMEEGARRPATFHDALGLARRTLTLPSYKLPVVAASLGVASFNHHNAEDDALACARIVLEIAAKLEVTELSRLFPASQSARRRSA